jgi:hypothetical protein
MKRIVAGVLTVALMGGLLWSGLRRPAGQAGQGASRANEPDPVEARLNALLDDAWRGDVSSYLDCFSGPIRERLGREVNERGRETFAADLRRAARSRKSHAVFSVEPEGDGAARITVETVYPDRNERQTYHLTRESGGWLVDDVETVRSQVPRARFGTVASYQEPEGVPVQGLAAQGVPLRVEADAGGGVDAGDDGTTPTPAPNP